MIPFLLKPSNNSAIPKMLFTSHIYPPVRKDELLHLSTKGMTTDAFWW